MKTLTATAQAEIIKKLGTEPFNIVEVDWKNNGLYTRYGDKDFGTVPGKIVSLSDFNDSSDALSGRSSQTISVTLDDTDSSIKTLLDTYSPHGVKCRVLQFYGSFTNDSDAFTLIEGQLRSPFTWSEGDRTVSFDILTNIVDRDLGMNYTSWEFLNKDNLETSQAWPIAFGNVRYVPGAIIKNRIEGELLDVMGIIDPTIAEKLDDLEIYKRDQERLLTFYQELLTGTQAIAPRASILIQQLIDTIVSRHTELADAAAIQDDIERYRGLLSGKNVDNAHKVYYTGRITSLESQLVRYFGTTSKDNIIIINEQEVTNFQGSLAILAARYEYLKYMVKRAVTRDQLRTNCFKKMMECVSNLYLLQQNYFDLVIEYCKQSRIVRDSVTIRNGHNFTVDETGKSYVVIDGLLWRGTFAGDVFTFDTPGIPEALYRDLEVDPWTQSLDTCADAFEEANIGTDAFYLKDSTININSMYCLVRTKTGTKHVIQITNQDGAECTFELRDKEGPNLSYRPHLKEDVSLDTAGNTNLYRTQLDAAYISALSGATLSQEEFDVLFAVQTIAPRDNASQGILIPIPTPRDLYDLIGEDIETVLAVASVPLPSWMAQVDEDDLPDSLYWSVAGGTVYDNLQTSVSYVANVISSTVKSVTAYREVQGVKKLVEVPSNYYTIGAGTEFGLTGTVLRFVRPLETMGNLGWSTEVYVCLQSSVDGNIANILEWIVENETTKSVDATSFAIVKAQLQDGGGTNLYPANFAILNRQEINGLLEEIAWQARCAIWEKNDIYYLRYLSAVPTSRATFTKTDIELNSLILTSDSTEDLITKMNVTWKEDYLPTTEDKKIELKFNTQRFGVQEQDYNWFIYTDGDLVKKSATFWLIRLANVWKKVRLATFLTHLDLDYQDAITLNLTEFSTNPTIAEIQTLNYNTSTNTIEMELWLPIRFGEMIQYHFAYPMTATDIDFPLSIDTENGYTDYPIVPIPGA